MMAKKICEELDYDLEIVRLDWDSLIPALQSGQADCVIAGQSITAERLQAVDFSEPYYYATIVTLVKKGSKYRTLRAWQIWQEPHVRLSRARSGIRTVCLRLKMQIFWQLQPAHRIC